MRAQSSLLSGVFVCPECGEECLSDDRLKSHRTRKHGYRNQARAYIDRVLSENPLNTAALRISGALHALNDDI